MVSLTALQLKSLGLREEQVVELHTIRPNLWDIDFIIQILIVRKGKEYNDYVNYINYDSNGFVEKELDSDYMHLLRDHRCSNSCYVQP